LEKAFALGTEAVSFLGIFSQKLKADGPTPRFFFAGERPKKNPEKFGAWF